MKVFSVVLSVLISRWRLWKGTKIRSLALRYKVRPESSMFKAQAKHFLIQRINQYSGVN